jgi:hypothetical protein
VCLNKNPSCSLDRAMQHLVMGGQCRPHRLRVGLPPTVEPSISVNRNVTTPEGDPPSDTRTGCHTEPRPTSHIGGSGPETPAPRGAA